MSLKSLKPTCFKIIVITSFSVVLWLDHLADCAHIRDPINQSLTLNTDCVTNKKLSILQYKVVCVSVSVLSFKTV